MLRRLVKISLFLVIGALVTIVVSWTALIAGAPRMYATPTTTWAAGTPSGWPAPQTTSTGTAWGVRRVDQTAPVAGLRAPGSPDGSEAGGDMSSMYSSQATLNSTMTDSGWPWYALRSRQWAIQDPLVLPAPDPVSATLWAAGWPVSWKLVPAGALSQPRLPIRPIWPGFALGAVAFGLAAAGLWRTPRTINLLYRRRCGLCTACGYPASATTVCPECGRPVRPWSRPPSPPGPVSRRERRLRHAMIAAIILAAAMYVASGFGRMYVKGPDGWFVAAWNGHFAVGRSSHAFEAMGLEAAWYEGSFRWGFDMRTGLVGSRLSIPLWAPLPLTLCLVFPHWWRTAVRRGLRRHWPAEEASSAEPRIPT